MTGIIECVPNFSTSNPKIVKAILNEIEKVKGNYILDYTFDTYYNRLVVSYIGSKSTIFEAMLNSAKKAIELIDMRKHAGQHPRIGAVDDVPFIPIHGTTMQDCIGLAKKFGKSLAQECNIPVYLYGEAALKLARVDIDWIRKGEYENLSIIIKKNERKPDFGPSELHPTAGAMITGARPPLISFNINLGTKDLNIAKKVAKAIHLRSGGLVNIKAMGTELAKKDYVQVGISNVNFRKTPLYRQVELVRIEAARYGVPIIGTELIGVLPLDAILNSLEYYLQLENPQKLEEKHLI